MTRRAFSIRHSGDAVHEHSSDVLLALETLGMRHFHAYLERIANSVAAPTDQEIRTYCDPNPNLSRRAASSTIDLKNAKPIIANMLLNQRRNQAIGDTVHCT